MVGVKCLVLMGVEETLESAPWGGEGEGETHAGRLIPRRRGRTGSSHIAWMSCLLNNLTKSGQHWYALWGWQILGMYG